VGIDKTLKTVADLQKLAVDGISLVKAGPIGFGSLARLFGILSDIKDVANDAQGALPELKDVDAVEAGQLAAAAYVLVKAVMVAVAA
jgi:hypothetical protein